MKEKFLKLKEEKPEYSLDQLLYHTYLQMNTELPFEEVKEKILDDVGIDEMEYYLRDVDAKLREYIEKNVWTYWDLNDKGHGPIHRMEVTRRVFALNETFHLGLNPDMLYAIANWHDVGKYVDHKRHHLIAAEKFMEDEGMKQFFSDSQRKIIKEAIEDHRSSKEDEPRSDYGKLISSADRNTTIKMVFIRSFFVAKDRMPDTNIEEYLDYTVDRLRKRYSLENPENMFYEDDVYQIFLKDMRNLLSRPRDFKNLYCDINHITDRSQNVDFYPGIENESKVYQRL